MMNENTGIPSNEMEEICIEVVDEGTLDFCTEEDQSLTEADVSSVATNSREQVQGNG